MMGNLATIQGVFIPETIKSNEWVLGCLLACFFMTSLVLSQWKATIKLGFREFFSTHERTFSEQSSNDIYMKIMLISQFCILLAILSCFFLVAIGSVEMLTFLPEYLLIVACCMLSFIGVKWMIYKFVNWIFFNTTKCRQWITSYFFILYMMSLVLLPVTFVFLFVDLPFLSIKITAILVIICLIILLFYRAFCIFFNNFHGLFYLIVYFCTLEILPLLVIWKGLGIIKGVLI